MHDDVRLREVTPDDLPIFFAQQDDPEANRMAAFPARDAEAFAAHWTKILAAAPTGTIQTVLFQGRVAGYVVAFEQHGRHLVGYWLGREFWGRGLATRGLAQFLDRVEWRPLQALVAPHNRASIRVLEKCGFEVCGEEDGDLILKLERRETAR